MINKYCALFISDVDTKVAMIPVKVDLSQENNEGKSLNLKDANHTNFHS